MDREAIDPRVQNTVALFSTIYLGGIPAMITNDSAFLSFLNVLSATEALAGFRYATTVPKPGARFKAFVSAYFPEAYKPYVDRMWRFRCRMVHSFSPAGFALTHHHSENHFRIDRDSGNPILNAEDLYAALLTAAQAYFAELRSDVELRRLMITRIEDRQEGGPIAVGPVRLA